MLLTHASPAVSRLPPQCTVEEHSGAGRLHTTLCFPARAGHSAEQGGHCPGDRKRPGLWLISCDSELGSLLEPGLSHFKTEVTRSATTGLHLVEAGSTSGSSSLPRDLNVINVTLLVTLHLCQRTGLFCNNSKEADLPEEGTWPELEPFPFAQVGLRITLGDTHSTKTR